MVPQKLLILRKFVNFVSIFTNHFYFVYFKTGHNTALNKIQGQPWITDCLKTGGSLCDHPVRSYG